jgi:hypothetical protein
MKLFSPDLEQRAQGAQFSPVTFLHGKRKIVIFTPTAPTSLSQDSELEHIFFYCFYPLFIIYVPVLVLTGTGNSISEQLRKICR